MPTYSPYLDLLNITIYIMDVDETSSSGLDIIKDSIHSGDGKIQYWTFWNFWNIISRNIDNQIKFE